MLKTRVIPVLLVKDVGLVKGVGFDSWRRVGAPLPAVKVFNTRDVDELVLLDISATPEGREPDYDLVASLSEECFVPLTVGGGIGNIESIRELLRVGADKVSINSAGYADGRLLAEAADRFGTQCVVAAIDVKNGNEGYGCYSHCGTRPTGLHPVEWAQRVESLGAGEILLTSIDRDGTMEGYDLELIRQVSESVSIPVIAAGGAGSYEDMHKALVEAKASAVAAASMFLFTECTPLAARNYLLSQGVPVRRSIGSSVQSRVTSP